MRKRKRKRRTGVRRKGKVELQAVLGAGLVKEK